MESLYQRIRQVSAPHRCDDWAARLEDLCEEFWQSLDGEVGSPDSSTTDAFVHLLSDGENFVLARMVIPELRGDPDSDSSNHTKQKILDCLRPLRAQHYAASTQDQSSFDSRLYQEEKDVLREANLHRAKLLFLGRANLSEEDSKRFQEWWESCPVKSQDRILLEVRLFDYVRGAID